MQIGESAGTECKAALQETTQLVEQKLATEGTAVKTLFGAAQVWLFSLQHETLSALQNGEFKEFSSIFFILHVDL